MFGFLLKKTVFDGWEHVLELFLANIGLLFFLAVEGLFWYLNATGTIGFSFTMLLLTVGLFVICFYMTGLAVFTSNINSGIRRGQTFKGILPFVKTHVKHVVCFFFIVLIIFVNILFAVPFYKEMGGITGSMMSYVSLFLSLFLIFGFKFYLPLCVLRKDESAFEIIKYSFAYAMDNKGLTFLLMFRSVIDILVSVPLMAILPGFAGILLSDTCAMTFLNERYVQASQRRLEKNHISWDDVFEKFDKSRYENRTFKSFLFPHR